MAPSKTRKKSGAAGAGRQGSTSDRRSDGTGSGASRAGASSRTSGSRAGGTSRSAGGARGGGYSGQGGRSGSRAGSGGGGSRSGAGRSGNSGGARRSAGTRSRYDNEQRLTQSRASRVPKPVRKEVSGLILLAFGLIMGLGLFVPDATGLIGELLGQMAGGFFGIMGWVLPVLICLQALYRILSKSQDPEWPRFFSALLMMAVVAAIFQTGSHEPSEYSRFSIARDLTLFWREGLSSVGMAVSTGSYSGGVFGGILGVPLLLVFRKAGTMIILVILALILALVITRLSIASAAHQVARSTGSALSTMKESARRRREQRDFERELELEEANERERDARWIDVGPNQPALAGEAASVGGHAGGGAAGAGVHSPAGAGGPGEHRAMSAAFDGLRGLFEHHPKKPADAADQNPETGRPMRFGGLEAAPAGRAAELPQEGKPTASGNAHARAGDATTPAWTGFGAVSLDIPQPKRVVPSQQADAAAGADAGNVAGTVAGTVDGPVAGSAEGTATGVAAGAAAASAFGMPSVPGAVPTASASGDAGAAGGAGAAGVAGVAGGDPDADRLAAAIEAGRSAGLAAESARISAARTNDPEMLVGPGDEIFEDDASIPYPSRTNHVADGAAVGTVAALLADAPASASPLAPDPRWQAAEPWTGGVSVAVHPSMLGGAAGSADEPTEEADEDVWGETGWEDEAVLQPVREPISNAGFGTRSVAGSVSTAGATAAASSSSSASGANSDAAFSRMGDGSGEDDLGLRQEMITDGGDLPIRPYTFPPSELLKRSTESEQNMMRIRNSAQENVQKLEKTLESFGIGVKVIHVAVGPAFTRYELQPAPGIKVSRIVNLTDDIALNLAAAGVRIEAPIPGKAAIGVEIPNTEVAPISLRSVLESPEFTKHPSKLAVAMGKDISGDNVVIDLAKMPHLLIAGATGSGKSVCINSIIISLLYKSSPDEVKLLMIDPKVVELGVYNGIPHLLIPVVTDANKAAGALRWAVQEMVTRYRLFAERGVRDLAGYNADIDEAGEGIKLPQMVIIIDELADLMMVAPNDVEDSICRLAQMARAAGMYLVIATQRPSVNVITGVIKANIPSRIAFAVSSQVDSRTIIDMVGAEKLLGKGDMLYYPSGIPKPLRAKGAFISDKEVEAVVEHVKAQMIVRYDEDVLGNINEQGNAENGKEESDKDGLLNEAIEAVIDCGQASVSFIQRKFKVGYARAGRIIDQMADRGIISGYEGSKPRRVLLTRAQWMEMTLARPEGG